jgi:hypothetical protein
MKKPRSYRLLPALLLGSLWLAACGDSTATPVPASATAAPVTTAEPGPAPGRSRQGLGIAG